MTEPDREEVLEAELVPSSAPAVSPAATTPALPVRATAAPVGFWTKLKRAFGIRSPEEKAAVDRYLQVALAAAEPGADLASVPASLSATAAEGRMKPEETLKARLAGFHAVVERVLEDDLVHEEEESYINGVAEALGIDNAMLNRYAQAELIEITIARANAGRLAPQDEHQLLAKSGEEVYHEAVAQLLKEVTIKEYRGGYGGVSLKVSKNMRVNTGGVRGRMVPVGTEIQAIDVGIFSITNQRAVYMGSKKTLEFRFDKLVGAQLFEDALTLQVSNRQTPSTFSFDNPSLVAAILNAAAAKVI